MNLPETIKMFTAQFGDGQEGYAIQILRNNEFCIQCDAVRAKRGAPWVEIFTSDHLPGQAFPSFKALREAVLATPAPAAFMPVVIEVKSRDPRNHGKCWLCHEIEYSHSVTAKTGWRDRDVNWIPSCDVCLEAVKADPVAAVESRHKWVREHPVRLKEPVGDDPTFPF